MAIPSSLTLSYDAILTTTLFNYRSTMEDQISTNNTLLFQLKKKQAYKKVSTLGDRIVVPLMYELGKADSYSGYDVLDTTPMDGATNAFFSWAQASVPIVISGLEEKKNTGEAQLINLLSVKVKQATMGMQEFVNKGIQQGNRASDITTPYTSTVNGSTFVDPLPLLVKYDPTTSTTVGNINQATYSWWQNKYKAAAATTYAGTLAELRTLFNNCSKGPGGPPDWHIVDQQTFEFYEKILASYHQNPSYARADIPFETVLFRGQTVLWDEFVPNVTAGNCTASTTQGTWYMLNTNFIEFIVHSGTDFVNTPFQKPENQDAKVSHILLLCGTTISNRRKQGIMGSIDTTVAS